MPDDIRAPTPADENLPVLPMSALVPMSSMPLALQIFFDDRLFDRCRLIATYMAKAEGFTPKHLVGKLEACFAVVSRSLTWKLDPYAVAQATYQPVPGAPVGYFGSLCQAIIENSGRLQGGVRYEHFGDWSKVQRKFRIIENTNDQTGKKSKFAVPAWAPEDEDGLGVKVIAQVKDELEPRTLEFFLVQAFPRNSTLWATDPMTQIKYTAVRRFATSVAPTLFLGVPFDHEAVDEWAETLKDVTPREPRPRIEDVDKPRATHRTPSAPITDVETDQGKTHTSSPAGEDTDNGKEETGGSLRQSAGDASVEDVSADHTAADQKAADGGRGAFEILMPEGEVFEVDTLEALRERWNAAFETPMSPDQIIGMWKDNADVRKQIYEAFGSAAMDQSFARFKQAEAKKAKTQPGLFPGLGQVPGAPSDEAITLNIDEGWGIKRIQSEFRKVLTQITNLDPALRKTTIERFRQLNGAVEIKLNQRDRAWMEQNVHPVYAQIGVRI
jgi:hypothetical protein